MRAARWIRVSSGSQDEQSQIPVIDAECAKLGWTVVERVFRLHDKSASKGEQQAEQDAAVAAMANGEFDILVCTESDRLDRRGPRAAYAFLWKLELASGRPQVVHVANDPMFGQDDIGSEILSTARMAVARDEVALKQRRIADKFREMDANGAFRGMTPAGYESVGAKYAKRLVPSSRAQDVRDAFADAVSMSTTALGTRLGMTADAVAKMIRKPVYSTGQYTVKRADGVTVIHRCEPLVTPGIQARAIAAIERRRTGDNVTSRALAKDDFSGALWCHNCGGGTMHRYYGGKDGAHTRRYICRKCRKSVKADNADAAVNEFMSASMGMWIEPVWIDGDDHQAELDRVQMELRELPARGLDDDEEDSERTRLRAERKRLEVLPRTSGHWEGRMSDKSVGALWDAKTTSERRAWAVSGEFKLWVKATGDRSGNVTVDAEWDGDDEAAA